MKKILLTFCWAVLALSAWATAKPSSATAVVTIYYVDTNAVGLNNGSTWANAYTNLQTALSNAVPPAEIWVAQGTYFPTTLTSDNFAAFHLLNGIAIFGGFNGTETALNQRNPSVNITTLSGDLDQSLSFTGGDSYHVVLSQNEDSTAVLDGFTISGGNAQGGNIWDMSGGGFSHQPTVSGYLNPIIRNCIFSANNASAGAAIGIINWNVAGATVKTQITNCKIINNSGYGNGTVFTECQGAGSYVSSRLENVLIANNTCGSGYAGVFVEHANGGSSNFKMIGCTIANNNGGLDIVYTTYGGPGSFTFYNCSFYGETISTDAFFQGDFNNIPYNGAISGGGNIYLDPLYVNPAGGDFHLNCQSPNINSGSSSYPYQTTDLDGNPRQSSFAPDCGAYETNFFPPSVTANASVGTACQNDGVTFTGSGASTYSWSHGITDGVPYPISATDTYTVTGTDANGCVGTSTVIVNVNPLPTITIGTATNTVCVGNSVTLTGSGASTYVYDNGALDGVAFTAATTTTYNCAGTDANGCIGTATITITVNPLPVVIPGATTDSICAGGSVTLTGSGAISYIWNNGVSDGIPFTPASTITYSLTGVDLNGCSDDTSITVTYLVPPSNGAVTLTPNDSVCLGTTLSYDLSNATGSGPFTYFMYHGGGPSSGPNPVFNWTPPGTEIDSLWVVDVYGCASPADIFNIYTYPNTDIGGHVAYSGGDLANANVYLIKQGAASASYDTVGTTVTDPLGIYGFTSQLAGNYYVKIIPQAGNPNLIDTYYGDEYLWDSASTVTHGCLLNSGNTDITMVEIIPVPGTGNISGTVYEGMGFGQKLIAGPLGVMANVIPGVPVKVGKNPGGAIVAQTTTDGSGNYSFNNLPYDSYRIYTDIPGYPMDSSYAITLDTTSSSAVNLDYFVDSNSVYIDLTTSIHYQNQTPLAINFSLFPNPSDGKVFLKFPLLENSSTNKNCTIVVFDAPGNKVFSNSILLSDKENTKTEINLGELSPGIYSVTVTGSSISKTLKVVITK